MNIQLKKWQKEFQQFLLIHKNQIINLYGYPSGKSFMAHYDKKNKDRVYYHEESMPNYELIHENIYNGLTVIIISLDKLKDEFLDMIYFEVLDKDD